MERVECIVVGGGLAGLSAAYGLACAGHEVMLLERGDYCGAKNVTGGRLYLRPLQGIYPELWAEAPFERPVARELLTMIGDRAQTTMEIAADRFLRDVPQSYTVLRSKLDQWFRRAGHGKWRHGPAKYEGRCTLVRPDIRRRRTRDGYPGWG